MTTVAGWLGLLAVLANTAHLFSPVVLLIMRPDLRAAALCEWGRHIVVPVSAFFAAIVLPLWIAIAAYTAWNAYHYAMQHHGFWALTRWRARTKGQRTTMRTVWLAATVTGMFAMPALQWPMNLFHWFGDIGLSAWSSQRRLLFVSLILLSSSLGVILSNHGLIEMFPIILRVRLGIGFVHFALSAMIWPAALNRGRSVLRMSNGPIGASSA